MRARADLARRRLAAMVLKEWRQVLRDPASVLIAFVLPVVLLLVFGYALNLDATRTRIGLADQDGGAAATGLATAFRRSPSFEVVAVGDVPHLKDALVAGDIRGIVVIPQGFSRDAARGGGTIQAITDGTVPNNASFVAAYAEGVRATWAAAAQTQGSTRLPAPPLSIAPRTWFNPGNISRWTLVPGSIATVMTIIGTLLTALVIAREWERGTMEAIMATPLSMRTFIASKVLPYYLLGLIAMTICTLLATLLFGVPLRGSVPALFVIASAFLFAALGQGLMISALAKNQFVASQIALLTAFLPSLLLSGFIYEIASAPPWVRLITRLVPARYLIPPLQTVFLAGDDWALFLPDLAVLCLFGAVFFAITLRAMRRRIA